MVAYPDELVIHVTQKDINNALKEAMDALEDGKWSKRCPISRAVNRLFPDVEVSTNYNVKIYDEDGVCAAQYEALEVHEFVKNVDEYAIHKNTSVDTIKPVTITVRKSGKRDSF